MKPMGKRYSRLVEHLSELLNEEHVCGCGQSSCDIDAAYSNGYGLWAFQLFQWSGAASEEFTRVLKRLPKRYPADAERERKALVADVPHAECPHCNAVLWDVEPGPINCDSCAQTFSVGAV